MAEAGIAAFGTAAGVAIAMAIVLFALRGKGHPEVLVDTEWDIQIKLQECSQTCHNPYRIVIVSVHIAVNMMVVNVHHSKHMLFFSNELLVMTAEADSRLGST